MKLFTFVIVMLAARTTVNNAATTNIFNRNSDARQFNTNAAFTEVIPSNDITSHDTIFVTPSIMFIGNSNGDIFRCLLKDPSVCELFYSYRNSTDVTGIVINGEYLFASLANGVMIQYKLYENICTAVYTTGSKINCLVAAGGYVYAGLQDGRMLRCELNRFNCKTFNTLRKGIYTLAATEKYIYAGLDTYAEIWGCSVSSENSCRLTLSVSYTRVQGMVAVKETVFGLTAFGTLCNCTRGNPCHYRSLPTCDRLSVFNRYIYIMHSSNITICNWGADYCSFFDRSEGATSMAFAYSTHKMQARYLDEEKTCLSDNRCPPFITYYGINERPSFEVYVRDGKLYNSLNVLVDTRDADVGQSGRAAIFAMGPDGQILLSNVHYTVLRTSSFFAGQPVSGAGEMVVENGVIKSIRACSDHYRPSVELNQQTISALYMKGYTARIESLPCCSDNEYELEVHDNVMISLLETFSGYN